VLQPAQGLKQMQPRRSDISCNDGFLQSATGLGFMLAVTEPALPQKRAEFDKSGSQGIAIQMLQCKFLQAG